MHLFALFMLCMVALFGTFILLRRKKARPVKRWMIVGHGLGALVGLVFLLFGVFELYSESTLNEWNLIGLALIASVVFGGFLLFEKLLKGRKKPLLVQAIHGVFAVAALVVLTYSFTL